MQKSQAIFKLSKKTFKTFVKNDRLSKIKLHKRLFNKKVLKNLKPNFHILLYYYNYNTKRYSFIGHNQNVFKISYKILN